VYVIFSVATDNAWMNANARAEGLSEPSLNAALTMLTLVRAYSS